MRFDRIFHVLTVGLLVVVLLAGALPSPYLLEDAEGQVSLQCRHPDDRENTAGTDRKYHDLIPNATTHTMVVGGKDVAADPFGAYLVFETRGTLRVDFVVENIGTEPDEVKNADGSFTMMDVRVDLNTPAGDTLRKTTSVQVPQSGTTVTGNVTFSLAVDGAYTSTVRVNPDQAFTEECEDTGAGGTVNPDCTEADAENQNTQCHFTYYFNNNATSQLLVAAFPDLKVTSVSVDDPRAASRTSGAGTQAVVTATIANDGPVTAYAHTSTVPGDDLFAIGFAIEGATCEGTATGLVDVKTLPAGGQKTVSATCDLAGVAGDAVVTVSADHDDVVYESLEGNNKRTAVVHVPSPDIVVDYDTGLTGENGTFLLPAGQGLGLNLTIENAGDAPAAADDGSGFTTKVMFEAETEPIKETTFRLESFETVTETAFVPAAKLTPRAEPYTVRILPDMADTADDEGEVLETDEKNLVSFKVLVASFDVALSSSGNETTVPPGVAGKVPITVENAGTVTDTISLDPPAADADRVRYTDANGNTVSTVRLDAEESLDLFFEYTLPRDATKDQRFTLRAAAASTTTGANATSAVDLTFVTGDDTVAPTVALHDPASGVLKGDKVTIQVTDNVEVAEVEANLGGTFETLVASEGNPAHYVLDVTGNPGRFSFDVRASDLSGNQVTRTIEVIRDDTPPRFVSYEFAPESGAVPGQKVRLTLDVRDDNMARVFMTIRQAPDYEVRLDAVRGGGGWFVDWTVPTKPGRFLFEVVAEDQAGNRAVLKDPAYGRYNELVPYFAAGYDIEVLNGQNPSVFPRQPQEGQEVRFTYQLRNTNPQFGMGRFEVRLGVDFETFADRAFVELGPGETKPVTLTWTAIPGSHTFTIVVDQTDMIPESDETNNNPNVVTRSLFSGQALFEDPEVRPAGFLTFTERFEKYWFLPVLVAANVVLFIVAAALGRRPTS